MAPPDSVTATIYSLFSRLPRFDLTVTRYQLPANDVYIFFEAGETIETADGIVDLIVRVGTHRADGRFPGRIPNHARGNRRGSVFRRHVGGALLSRTTPNDPLLIPWLDPAVRNVPDVEQFVSRTMRDRLSFVAIRVDDASERLLLERRLIALLAQHPLGAPSSSWLGHHAVNPLIGQPGLWNTQGVSATPLESSNSSRHPETTITCPSLTREAYLISSVAQRQSSRPLPIQASSFAIIPKAASLWNASPSPSAFPTAAIVCDTLRARRSRARSARRERPRPP